MTEARRTEPNPRYMRMKGALKRQITTAFDWHR
jgi:hypothetical protein